MSTDTHYFRRLSFWRLVSPVTTKNLETILWLYLASLMLDYVVLYEEDKPSTSLVGEEVVLLWILSLGSLPSSPYSHLLLTTSSQSRKDGGWKSVWGHVFSYISRRISDTHGDCPILYSIYGLRIYNVHPPRLCLWSQWNGDGICGCVVFT